MAIVPEQPRDTSVAPAPALAPPAPARMPTPRVAPASRRLHPAVWRLALLAVLFTGWIGYLFYLVRTRSLTPAGTPLVVSRSQVLVSEIDVVARVNSLDGPVTVEQVLWQKDPSHPVRPEDTLLVGNLKDCRPFGRSPEDTATPADFTGPGLYLLLLHRDQNDVFQVVPVPFSPGYPPPIHKQGQPRLYPATADVLAQYKASPKPPHQEVGEP
jgi:hypothetical protein